MVEGVYDWINDDRIDIEFLKSKGPRIIIHYDEMVDMQNVDADNRVYVERITGLDVLTTGIGTLNCGIFSNMDVLGLSFWARLGEYSHLKYLEM